MIGWESAVTRPAVRVLDRRDREAALEICARNPVAHVFVASRIASFGLTGRPNGGELWGWFDRGELTSLCWPGANLVPVEATSEAIEGFATRARRTGRRCSSIVGPADQALALWGELAPSWGRARDVRPDQPLMVCDGPVQVAPDAAVRTTRDVELDLLVPACVAMFTEEVGYSPTTLDGGAMYRSQVASLIAAGRSLARVDRTVTGARVVFKAEIGSASAQVAQVQGVWVHPADRGRGIAAPGMAAVVELARAQIAPRVSLYVNAYNERAIRTYLRVGFVQVGTFATVLF
jgi:uncharacterized protein